MKLHTGLEPGVVWKKRAERDVKDAQVFALRVKGGSREPENLPTLPRHF